MESGVKEYFLFYSICLSSIAMRHIYNHSIRTVQNRTDSFSNMTYVIKTNYRPINSDYIPIIKSNYKLINSDYIPVNFVR